MKEIIIHLIDRCFDDIDGCMIILICFGLLIVVPIMAALTVIIK